MCLELYDYAWLGTAVYAMAAGTSLNLSLLRINTLVARYLFFSLGKYVDYIAGATNNVSISLLPVHVRVGGIRSCLEFASSEWNSQCATISNRFLPPTD